MTYLQMDLKNIRGNIIKVKPGLGFDCHRYYRMWLPSL